MERKNIIRTAALIILQMCSLLWAAPTTSYEAEMVVTGWLKADPKPLGTALGRQVMKVETFTGDKNEPVYYIVYLQPFGFVIVPADDLVEPIIGFVNGSSYNPSVENPLGALVTNDIKERIAEARNLIRLLATTPQTAATKTQNKWTYYISLGESSNDGFHPMNAGPIRDGQPSDVRIAPLIKTKWYQRTICEKYYDNVEHKYKLRNLGIACQNYYTPRLVDSVPVWDEDHTDNFPCGCVATAMAQLMRYHTYPDRPNQPNDPCTVRVGIKDNHDDFNDVDTAYPHGTWPRRYFLGGDQQGGAYRWGDMQLIPDENTTQKQRKAIGAICHDAGISVHMKYSTGGSGASMSNAQKALITIFLYSNAVYGSSGFQNIGPGLIGMINPNLDAKHAVMLSIPGHAILVDGYGYGYSRDDSTSYHHLNMGWYGLDDCWYNLPDIECRDTGKQYQLVDVCLYNIFISNGNEIISGRVLDSDGNPAVANTVVLEHEGRTVDTTETDASGIYAFIGVNSDTTYTLWVEAREFTKRQVRTGASIDLQSVSGNRWGIDFPDSTKQGILYVNCNMNEGKDNGSDWENAFIDLQDAIEVAANSGGEVTEIWVVEGTYMPDKERGLRTLSFQLLNGVGIYGGFAGNETEREQRNPQTNETILSGDLNEDDGEDSTNTHENSYHVVNGSGTNETAIIDGFTVTGGNASGTVRAYGHGAGMYISVGSPTVNNCIFTNNKANGYGGGMYNYHDGNPILTNCKFVGNSAASGGGIRNYNSSPILENCTFSGNTADNNGGGMYNSSSNPMVINCTFKENSAAYGSGMYNRSNSAPNLIGCMFKDNSAVYGGGMRNYESSPTLETCTFSGNSADNRGGGMYNSSSNPIVTNCTFTENSATYGGGMYNRFDSHSTLTECTFRENSAEWGGGLHNHHSDPTATNCMFAGNHSQEDGGAVSNSESSCHFQGCTFMNNIASDDGGAVRDFSCNSHCVNCLFVNNQAMDNGGAVYNGSGNDYAGQLTHLINCTFSDNNAEDYGGAVCDWTGGTTIVSNCILWGNADQRGSRTTSQINATNDPIVSYSCVQSTDRDPWPGEGNIKSDPLFANPANGDFHLKSRAGRWNPIRQGWIQDYITSPCVDAGDPSSSVDLEPVPNGGRINMGAYGGTVEASKSP